jgi:hypothetical protein
MGSHGIRWTLNGDPWPGEGPYIASRSSTDRNRLTSPIGCRPHSINTRRGRSALEKWDDRGREWNKFVHDYHKIEDVVKFSCKGNPWKLGKGKLETSSLTFGFLARAMAKLQRIPDRSSPGGYLVYSPRRRRPSVAWAPRSFLCLACELWRAVNNRKRKKIVARNHLWKVYCEWSDMECN